MVLTSRWEPEVPGKKNARDRWKMVVQDSVTKVKD